ncbi:uncharacterized protein LOC144861459 [Branchiostoma floridae x Branchiostoma japonicum]
MYLSENEISDIQAGTFSPTPRLINLHLYQNNLTNLRSDMFTGLGNLLKLYLYSNEISDIQAGTFISTPQLTSLTLDDNKLTNLRSDMFTGLGNLEELYLFRNRLTTLSSAEYDILSSISYVSIDNNPWHCDCRMFPFRLKMTGSHFFEYQIDCSQPDQFHGQKLIDINPTYLICDPQTCSYTIITLPVLLGAIFGSIAGTLLIVAIVLTIWCRRNKNNSPTENPDHAVVLTNANTTAVIPTGQTDQMRPQGSLTPQHRPKSPAPLPHEYETVKPHPENPRPRSADPRLTSLNDAYRNTDERPPFPFPRSADGDDGAAQYQSLRKTDTDHESADDYETPHDYVYVTE